MIELKSKFNKVYYTAKHDSQGNWVHTSWIGFANYEESIEAVKTTMKLLKESRCPNLLSDNSQIKGAWSDTSEWLEKNWFNNVVSYGLRKHATVVSIDIFAQTSHESFEKSQEGNSILMRNFEDIDEAKKWLADG